MAHNNSRSSSKSAGDGVAKEEVSLPGAGQGPTLPPCHMPAAAACPGALPSAAAFGPIVLVCVS